MSTDSNIDWNSVIKKEAVGISGVDLGAVYEVDDAFIITQKGLLDKKWYHIPRSLVENFDGVVLRLKVNENEMAKYEKTGDKKYENNVSSSKSSVASKDMETTIPLMAENLEVKKNIAEDSINITKEPIRETKTIQVKLTHEEILIERRPVNVDSNSYNHIDAILRTKVIIFISNRRASREENRNIDSIKKRRSDNNKNTLC